MKYIIPIVLLMSSLSFGALTEQGKFSGGLNNATVDSGITAEESPSLFNMTNNLLGSTEKRRGSVHYIDQAFSTNPFSSLFRAYVSTAGNVTKLLIGTVGDKIVVSTNDVNPVWTTVSSGIVPHQSWSYVQMNRKIIMAGDALVDPIFQYDIQTTSFTNLIHDDLGSSSVVMTAKFLINSKDYLIAANVRRLKPGTTYFTSRIYFSLLRQPSSMTALRFITFRTLDGEEITGLGEQNDRVHIFKETTISELEFSILDLIAGGSGDWTTKQIVSGFGLYAPRTLVTTGDFYILGAKDGLRLWERTTKSRLELEQESRVISDKIKPLIDRLIEAGTYRDSVGYYYPKRQWYVFAYEDPDKFPKGKINSTIVWDLRSGEWFPFKNLNIEAITSFDGITDKGEIVYAQSHDSYVDYFDVDGLITDPKRELLIHSMDDDSDWVGGDHEIFQHVEGTASVRLTAPGTMTYLSVLSIGTWPDGTTVNGEDELTFKIRVTSLSNLMDFRIDLQVQDETSFNLEFTSVTVSSHAFVEGQWTDYSVALGSFPLKSSWLDLSIEDLPFANALVYYGLRIVSTGIGGHVIQIDDIRIKSKELSPVEANRFTKQLDFGALEKKTFHDLYLHADLNSDGSYFVDKFVDFGLLAERIKIPVEYKKELFITGYNGTENITKLNSKSYSIIDSTDSGSESFRSPRPIWFNGTHLFYGDQFNSLIGKIHTDTMSVVQSTFGSLGSGAQQFDGIAQITGDDKTLYIADRFNNRVTLLNQSDLSFVKNFGQLGLNATSYHAPNGVAVNSKDLFIANDGNRNIVRVNKRNGDYKATIQLDIDVIGDITLAVDERFLFVAYNQTHSTSIHHQNVFIEKRDIASGKLIDRKAVFPQSRVSVSTYALEGDISQSDTEIIIPFTSFGDNSVFSYVQFINKDTLELINEIKLAAPVHSVAYIGTAYKPNRQIYIIPIGGNHRFLQLNYDSPEADKFILYGQSFKLTKQEER